MAQEQDKERAQPVAWIDMAMWPPIRWPDDTRRCDVQHLDGLPLYAAPQPNAALADGWVSVDERLPMEPDEAVPYEQESFIVTDGQIVTTTDFARGSGAGKAWANWSMYGGVRAHCITHWMPFPKAPAPPTLNASKEGSHG